MTSQRRKAAPARKRKPGIRPGARMDGFRVGELLHEGGMSRIYHVTHPRHSLPMVMKVPRLEPQAPLSGFNAFENECRILRRLHGPHVPRFIAAGDNAANPYLVMEFIEGDRFAQAAKHAPLAVAELTALAMPVCRALHDLHRQNVIHLDLNPGNVRNRADGEAVLIDFGLAHHAALPDVMDAAFGEDEGTTAYIAPEQVRHLRSESRSDIYALGACLYQLATGHYPFGRPNLISLKRRLVQPPLPPRFYNPHIPAWLQEIILHCLEIRPDHRYHTAKRVAYLLAHPEAVALTRRAHRLRPEDHWTRARLWLCSLYRVFENTPPVHPHERLASSPHVLVAIDPARTSTTLNEAMLRAVERIAHQEKHSYFTCLAVVTDEELEANADALLERQIAMRRWAKPLRLPPERIVFHALTGGPADKIVEYARQHVVDQIIIGERRRSGAARRFLGGLCSKVTAQAPCTVTVMRPLHAGV